jgi:hypothetical protein
MALGPKSSSNKPAAPAPKLPAPKVPHIYVEKGLGAGKTEKR